MGTFIPVKLVRIVTIIGLVLAVILFIAMAVLQAIYQPPAAQPEDAPAYQPEISAPEAYEFLNTYFDQIKRGNIDILLSDFWTDSVRGEIAAKCANPLGQTTDSLTVLWGKCASLSGIRVEIIDIVKTDDGYEALIQLYDANDQIAGVELRPERALGLRVRLMQTDQGLRTPDWYFL